MARSSWHRALDAFLHRLQPPSAAAFLRLLAARQEKRLGQASAGAIAGPSRRSFCRTHGTRMAAQEHSVDALLSRSVGRFARPEGGEEEVGAEVRCHGRWRDLYDAAA